MKCDPWAMGKFILIGDAAHCNNPILGLGLNLGLEDATTIVDLLVKY